MASGSVDDGVIGQILAIVDHNRPDVDEAEQHNVRVLVQREEEGEDVVRQTLRVTVQWMECVGREWRGHDPLVMRLVESLVQVLGMQRPVYEVDEGVGEHQKQGKLRKEVEPTVLLYVGVHLRMPAHLCHEPRHCEDRHDGQSLEGLLDLEPDLILEELGVIVCPVVENEDVTESRERKVGQEAENPGYGEETERLSQYVVARENRSRTEVELVILSSFEKQRGICRRGCHERVELVEADIVVAHREYNVHGGY